MDDADLVRAAAGGDREAFDELVRRHQGAILSLARAMTGGAPDAEDLAQETFIRAWSGLGRFRGDSAFRTWLHGIALNVVRTHRGRLARLRQLFQPARHDDSGSDPIDRAAVDERVEEKLVTRQQVDRALAELPVALREAVVLREIQGFDYKEIAAMLGVPIGTVESRIFRARQRLRPLLRDECPHQRVRATDEPGPRRGTSAPREGARRGAGGKASSEEI
jgi:RNA polymerase sigma-70 factor, ECF subfamily